MDAICRFLNSSAGVMGLLSDWVCTPGGGNATAQPAALTTAASEHSTNSPALSFMVGGPDVWKALPSATKLAGEVTAHPAPSSGALIGVSLSLPLAVITAVLSELGTCGTEGGEPCAPEGQPTPLRIGNPNADDDRPPGAWPPKPPVASANTPRAPEGNKDKADDKASKATDQAPPAEAAGEKASAPPEEPFSPALADRLGRRLAAAQAWIAEHEAKRAAGTTPSVSDTAFAKSEKLVKELRQAIDMALKKGLPPPDPAELAALFWSESTYVKEELLEAQAMIRRLSRGPSASIEGWQLKASELTKLHDAFIEAGLTLRGGGTLPRESLVRQELANRLNKRLSTAQAEHDKRIAKRDSGHVKGTQASTIENKRKFVQQLSKDVALARTPLNKLSAQDKAELLSEFQHENGQINSELSKLRSSIRHLEGKGLGSSDLAIKHRRQLEELARQHEAFSLDRAQIAERARRSAPVK